MPLRNIVRGQRIKRHKLVQAKLFRRDQTPSESLLWQYLRRNSINGLHFRRQQIIDGFIVDFYCHAASLVIEIDGGIHSHQKELDAERQGILESKGLSVLRFTNEEVLHKIGDVLETIARVCQKQVKGRT